MEIQYAHTNGKIFPQKITNIVNAYFCIISLLLFTADYNCFFPKNNTVKKEIFLTISKKNITKINNKSYYITYINIKKNKLARQINSANSIESYISARNTLLLLPHNKKIASGIAYQYNAYGKPIKNISDDSQNSFFYNQERYDLHTGMQYLQSRFYLPVFKRFINQDSADFTNKFNYADLNPINKFDANGHNSSLFLEKLALALNPFNDDSNYEESSADFTTFVTCALSAIAGYVLGDILAAKTMQFYRFIQSSRLEPELLCYTTREGINYVRMYYPKMLSNKLNKMKNMINEYYATTPFGKEGEMAFTSKGTLHMRAIAIHPKQYPQTNWNWFNRLVRSSRSANPLLTDEKIVSQGIRNLSDKGFMITNPSVHDFVVGADMTVYPVNFRKVFQRSTFYQTGPEPCLGIPIEFSNF